MTQYFFIFGKTPQLSKAELENVLRKNSIEFKEVLFDQEIFLLETNEKISLNLFNQLGGSVKYGEIICESKQLTPEEIVKLLDIGEQKITFGISDYSKRIPNIQKLGLEMKKIIKQKAPCRFVNPKTKQLTSVSVTKNKLLDSGAEFCFFHQHGMFLTGKTLAVQDFEMWNKLDYGRPEFDPKIGMLPPKVAQIMLNLIPTKSDDIWDPFCGFGTILQQAAVLGYKNIFGSDINETIAAKAQANIDWLTQKLDIQSDIEIKTLNITKAEVKDLPFMPKTIVAEPFLGKPLTGRETQTDLNKIKSDIQTLYLKSFEKFSQLLEPKHFVIFIFPKYRLNKQIIDTSIDSNIKQLGYKLLSGFDYSRPSQHLIRRITVWEKA